MGPSEGKDHVILAGFVEPQYQRMTDGRSDGRTDYMTIERCIALAKSLKMAFVSPAFRALSYRRYTA